MELVIIILFMVLIDFIRIVVVTTDIDFTMFMVFIKHNRVVRIMRLINIMPAMKFIWVMSITDVMRFMRIISESTPFSIDFFHLCFGVGIPGMVS